MHAFASERIDAAVSRCYRRFKEWSKRKFSADDVTWCEVRADLIEIATAIASEIVGEECAKIAERWKSSLRPGTEARRLGHEEAAREIAAEIRASFKPTSLAAGGRRRT